MNVNVVTLKNKQKRMVVFNLDHVTACAEGCKCVRESTEMVVRAADGERAYKKSVRRTPPSITFLAEEKRDVAEYILKSPEVARAIELKHLVVLPQPKPEPAPEPKPVPEVAEKPRKK